MFNADKYIDLFKKYEEKILYLIFGFLTTVIYLGAYKLFLELKFQYITSANIAFIIAVFFAFFTNKHLVFKKGSNFFKEIAFFFGARVLTQLINNIGLVVMIEFFMLDEFISQFILSMVVIILNYIISKYAIFK